MNFLPCQDTSNKEHILSLMNLEVPRHNASELSIKTSDSSNEESKPTTPIKKESTNKSLAVS